MRNLIIFLLCLSLAPASAQTVPKFNGPEWKPPYNLPLEGWGIERFLIPIDFAPQINYEGVEDLRFTAGWGDLKSKDYWSYAYLWYLNGMPAINADSIATNLNHYYDGLIARNIKKRNIPANMVTPTKTTLEEIHISPGDLKTFKGKIAMLDYMGKRPIILNCMVHLRRYKDENKTILFHQISPQPFNAPIWQKFKQLWGSFKY
ncbi:MAG TPA: hypothetical protein VL053_12395 [Arachidicoccus sp.]|nr:hypothetical protein [Arachidicoccus sp.]